MPTECPNKRINLREVFLGLQQQMIATLALTRQAVEHPGTKGASTEAHWLKMLNGYLPKRYCATSAFIVDVVGNISDQIDVVIYDQHYSPFLFNQENARYIPAESVYAVLEVKQGLNASNIEYAGLKASSVRRLKRTSAPIPHAGGRFEPKDPPYILAGLLTYSSDWNPAFGTPLDEAFGRANADERIDIGCVLQAGSFVVDYSGERPRSHMSAPETALMFFFLRLLGRLQSVGTVAAMDLEEYSHIL
jgi:hypothetical protein